MRRKARVDANQATIVEELRAIGASVLHLHFVGRGCPDILCGFRGNNYLFEIKSPGGKLTKPEAEFLNNWRGQVCVIESAEEAIAILTDDNDC